MTANNRTVVERLPDATLPNGIEPRIAGHRGIREESTSGYVLKKIQGRIGLVAAKKYPAGWNTALPFTDLYSAT